MDINDVANQVYAHNHPNTEVWNKNIVNLKADLINRMKIDMILMSPPCQPHTRVGNRMDIKDNRSIALSHICSIIMHCSTLKYILLENVKGFETSEAHQEYISALKCANYYYREFILSPTILGIQNTRYRYYCLARKAPDFIFKGNCLWLEFPELKSNGDGDRRKQPVEISSILETFPDEESEKNYLLNEKTLLRAKLLDIVGSKSTNSMCFTRAYTRYIEGTGSIYCPCEKSRVDEVFSKLKLKDCHDIMLLQSLRLRYFTPREVARLMCFPDDFSFPSTVSKATKYRLLGNSINVRIVGELIKLLLE